MRNRRPVRIADPLDRMRGHCRKHRRPCTRSPVHRPGSSPGRRRRRTLPPRGSSSARGVAWPWGSAISRAPATPNIVMRLKQHLTLARPGLRRTRDHHSCSWFHSSCGETCRKIGMTSSSSRSRCVTRISWNRVLDSRASAPSRSGVSQSVATSSPALRVSHTTTSPCSMTSFVLISQSFVVPVEFSSVTMLSPLTP